MLERHPRDERLLLLIASFVSLIVFLYCLRHDLLLLYGDAVAHMSIARRTVDSLTPGPQQLGTVWLPLPHVLMLPFVWMDKAWTSGIAGSIASLIAYILATVGVFRLVSRFGTRTAAWIAALTFALNPNLLYLQSTAMTEAIYLCAFVWTACSFLEFWLLTRHLRYGEAKQPLKILAVSLAAATMTRYDGWFLAAVIAIILVGRYFYLERNRRSPLKAPLSRALVLIALLPGFWMAYNYGLYGNAFEFATGPDSARGIATRTAKPGASHHPGHQDAITASVYFLKSAKLNLGESRAHHVLFLIAAIAALIAGIDRRFRPALILWIAWPFYVLAIAYGSVPIFMPMWPPHSYYNIRYGLQLLPAIAVFTGVAFEMLRRVNWTPRYIKISFAAIVTVVAWCYTTAWIAVPVTFREARINAKNRIAFETQLADFLRATPPDARVLMFTGTYSGALQRAGFPFKRLVQEGNFGLWQRALANPSASADIVIAINDDAVARSVRSHPAGLDSVVVLHAPETLATIYRSRVRR